MRRKFYRAAGVPSVGPESLPPQAEEPFGKSRRKLLALIMIVTAACVVITVVFVPMVPQGLGETIPYRFSYTVGENLNYSMSMTVNAAGQQVSEAGSVAINVTSFDGENYTIYETVYFEVPGLSPQTSNFTLVMSESGELVGYSNLPSDIQNMTSMIQGMPGFGTFLNRTEIRVGETIQVPLNLGDLALNMTGTLNYNVGDVENITVPAGTFKTFKISISSSNVQASAQGVTVSLSLSGQTYMEYDTGHLVKMNMQETATSAGQTMSLTLDYTLTSDTKG